MRDNGEPDEFSAQDHASYPDTLRKVTAYLLDVDENGVNFGRVVRETGCRPDLVSEAISYLQIQKDGLPVLRAMHKVPERCTFVDNRCKSIPRDKWPLRSEPPKHVPYRGETYWRLDVS